MCSGAGRTCPTKYSFVVGYCVGNGTRREGDEYMYGGGGGCPPCAACSMGLDEEPPPENNLAAAG